ncbi:C/D box methylation guide ribonucleoprotein complex aNOP56 subunit [Acidianus manzaensis]|nr:C/D box methylation guide ribonucleoprotein complex aNOP56 subunit [Acidianus manzaensis]
MMKLYLVEHAIGSFGFDENGKLIDYVLNPKDIGRVVELLLQHENGEPFPSALELINKVKPEEIVIENEAEIQKLQVKATVKPHHEGAKIFRQSLAKFALESKFASTEDELYTYLYQLAFEYTRRKLRSAAQKRDLLAIQAVRAMDDIDKSINLFSERLREWYSLHFPELDKLLEDHETYAKIVSTFGYRDSITLEGLKSINIDEHTAKRIVDAASKSIGADISEDDINSIQQLSNTILSLFTIRNNLSDYIESVMKEVAPNVTSLVGSNLGARLLSLAGSLEELSKMPASTIQVLGAEKALFRALRSGSRPPKHGIIFQFPAIHSAPRWQRGKIARALAAKLAIAARVDNYSGRYIGDQLAEQLNKRIEEIKTKYEQPPPRKPAQSEKLGERRSRPEKRKSKERYKSKKNNRNEKRRR